MKKRLLAAVMSLCMIVSLLPVSAFALEDEGENPETETCICDTRCTEDNFNEDCTVCAADVLQCTGEEEQTGGEVPGEPETPGEPEEPSETEIPDETEEPGETEETGETEEPKTPANSVPTEEQMGAETAGEPVPYAEDAVYVSADKGSDDNPGTSEKPFATLAKAVDAAKDGDTIALLSDLDAKSLVRIDTKKITINGNGHKITRADNFTPTNDGRGGYNPEMIEVANGAELTLLNITLDDAWKTAGDNLKFLEQPTGEGSKDNDSKVQDSIIAAYRGGGTIILGNGTTLQNFGGMSAVRIGGPGQGGEGTSTLIMESGSAIVDDKSGTRAGGVAAVWSQGGKLVMEEGSEIRDIDGRAVYLEDGGIATIDGTIHNITSNDKMTDNPATGASLGKGATGDGFAGIVFALFGNSHATLTGNGEIYNIVKYSLQGTTQGNGLTGGLPPVRFSM